MDAHTSPHGAGARDTGLDDAGADNARGDSARGEPPRTDPARVDPPRMDVDPPRMDVVRLVQRLSVASLRFSDRSGAAHGLHRSDLQALQVLAEAREQDASPVSPGHLAASLALSPSATSTLLDRLERAGHVRRAHDETDRRKVTVSMTPSAGAEARAMFGPLSASMIMAMEEFDDDELDAVRRFVTRMTEVIEAQEP